MDYKYMAIELLKNKFDDAVDKHFVWREEYITLLKATNKQLYIFGTGIIGMQVYDILKQQEIGNIIFVDNNLQKAGQIIIDEVRCISPQELEANSKNAIVIIGIGVYSEEVFQQVKKMGINDILDGMEFIFNFSMNFEEKMEATEVIPKVEQVFNFLGDNESKKVLFERLEGFCNFEKAFGMQRRFFDIYRKHQYFVDDLIEFSDQDILVDCGAFTGDSLIELLQLNKPFKKYIAYELSKQNCKTLQENITSLGAEFANKIVVYNLGVGKDNMKITYCDKGRTTTKWTDLGQTEGNIVKLSDHLHDENVSFIKMDIEGAEVAALQGAEELLKVRKPKLAICVYHKLSDLWQIPLLIKTTVPDYHIYFRHHTPTYQETVCYAHI